MPTLDFLEKKRQEVLAFIDKDKKLKFELVIAFFLYGLIIFHWNLTAWKVEWTGRAVQLAFPLIMCIVLRRSINSIGLKFSDLGKEMGLGFLFGVFLLIIFALPLKQIPLRIPESFFSGLHFTYVVLLILTNVVPIELFLRGYLQPRIEVFTGPLPALVVVSILSGLDFWESWVFTSGLVVMGIATFFGLLYIKTRSIFSPIIAHTTFLVLVMIVI